MVNGTNAKAYSWILTWADSNHLTACLPKIRCNFALSSSLSPKWLFLRSFFCVSFISRNCHPSWRHRFYYHNNFTIWPCVQGLFLKAREKFLYSTKWNISLWVIPRECAASLLSRITNQYILTINVSICGFRCMFISEVISASVHLITRSYRVVT